ncbi:MAG: helix-turn-helix transcriptional regulator [Mesorhizobium sp.]|uniref:winged helix-turn-helix transcriptional regulator n=1 Tax=Mesorhizobium sp. TaxID=1871066 RepID=UPI0011F86873|nr:helix-turn-helix domain-containing protein [Mesorhizobium sp.]TIP74032.1 MAG: helix-turn-helix transcriptional regulator [Mesorhizobium sp.]TIQ14384.1 MAG: helix-turn-helix transcriptional regulator [Mesorhizobium sp.]TIR52459.1 MAG: helix-turn-helix transcriptional regulator [Mesorhizobium sp.]TJV95809.1 MAG: helix-turn-helix transcriptional regulator [Mesorhizobium sp.]
MDQRGGYGQFCPVSMASEILCSRWTTLVVRELLCGSTRFNDLRRGLPKMSPTLLSKRLKELQSAGVINVTRKVSGAVEYRLSEAGEELRPLIIGLGNWAQRWMESRLSLRNLDPSLLMWDMRRSLDVKLLPDRRWTIQFLYPELAEAQKNWWLVVEGGVVDLCNFNPGYDLDLLVKSSLRSMTAIWMGLTTIKKESDGGLLEIEGDPALARSMQQWLGLSAFAHEPRRVQ